MPPAQHYRGTNVDHLERTKREFGCQAAGFAASAAITDSELTKRFTDAIAADLTMSVLDVACGPGIVAAALAAVTRHVTALDLTREMLAKARDRCAKARLRNVTFHEGTATDLPFPDSSFDLAVTRLSIHHFVEPHTVLGEMRRVLKPGGILAVADIVSSEDAGKSALHNAFEVIRDPSHVRMLPASELESLIRDAGLEIEKQDTWDAPREFEEWAAIVANRERVDPLRVIMNALAQAGEDAGIGLSPSGAEIVFFHRWHIAVARKS